MTHSLLIDVVFPKISSKKSVKLLESNLSQSSFIDKIGPTKLLKFGRGDVEMELIDGLTLECHGVGCFHFNCQNLNQNMLENIRKTLPTLAETFNQGKHSEDINIILFGKEDNVPRNKIVSMLDRGVSSDFISQLKDLYQTNVKVGGIRLIFPPDLSCILDMTGISVRTGPRKITFDKLRDVNAIIELIEENSRKIKVIGG